MYQPPPRDRSLGHRTTTLPVVAPSLKVRSPCPAQLVAVSNFNEKLRSCRLEQAALLACVNALFEENIDDDNLAEDVPDNVAHNGSANLVVPNDESLEEIIKTNNTPLQVLVGAYDEKIDDISVPTHKELEMKDDVATLLEKGNKTEALRSSLEQKEKDFSVLSEKPNKRESMENQSLVDGIEAGLDMKKQDSQEEMEDKRRLFEDELKLKADELGKTGDAHSGSQALVCVYVDLNVSNVTSMNPRLPSLAADARLIPPGNDTLCLSIHGGVAKLFIFALNCHDNNMAGVSTISYTQHGSLLVILGGNDEGRRTTILWAFDPGGDTSPELLLSTLFVVLWFLP
ncbi:uncharacterized protein LOC121761210 [Salvia splendens]|uniref:uncharacterized protein LOC121761210 n=1 Tax=Salvia splendens TaxID=180675 RepID=UPI001C26A29B|nr:uncharacterized protein LOC121761210 [Salvia splendens]